MAITVLRSNAPVVNGLAVLTNYLAIPVFMTSTVLPPFKDLEITATVGSYSSNTIMVSSADTVVDITVTELTDPVRENTDFDMHLSFTATTIQDLEVKFNASELSGAVFKTCENYGGTINNLYPDNGVLNILTPRMVANLENGVANYELTCTYTAGAYVKGTAAQTVAIDVIANNVALKTADLTVPAPSRMPVAGTMLAVHILRDTLFSTSELTAILNAVVKVLQELDPTFDITRLFQIVQKLKQSKLSSVDTAAADLQVTISTTFTGVTVSDTAALATNATSAAEALGYTADAFVSSADIEADCTEGCGSDECGLCLDGQSCTSADQCFSDECNMGKCGGNSAATVSSVISVALAVAACFMLF
jgi:hypothetical protein